MCYSSPRTLVSINYLQKRTPWFVKLIDNDKEHFKLKVLACPVSKKSCMLLESTIRHEGFEMASKKETG